MKRILAVFFSFILLMCMGCASMEENDSEQINKDIVSNDNKVEEFEKDVTEEKEKELSFVPDIFIEELQWSVDKGTVKGNNYVLFSYTNNSQYIVSSFRIDFTEAEGVTEEQKTAYYKDIQASQGFDDEWMAEYIKSRNNLSKPISMYARVDDIAHPTESINNVKCYYHGGWTSKNVLHYNLFRPEKATIEYVKDNQDYVLYYNFESGIYELEAK